MRRRHSVGLVLLASLAIAQAVIAPEAPAQARKPLRMISEQTVTGFKFPESVAHDPQARVLYVSQFGSELKATEKDGKGRISRVALDGGGVLHKPKGIWVEGDGLWVTDIDVV